MTIDRDPAEIDEEVEDELLPDADDFYRNLQALESTKQLPPPREVIQDAEFEEVPIRP